MDYNKAVKVYTFTIPANGAFPLLVQSDYFRLQSATGAVDVSGDTFGTLPDLLTGQGLENTPYKRLVFTDKTGAPNTVAVLCSGDLFIDNRTYGVNSLDAATIALLRTPQASTGSFINLAALTANTAVNVFLPAANTAGAILLSADISEFDATQSQGGFVAKASAPASVADGEPMLMTRMIGAYSTTNHYFGNTLPKEQYIPAGLGLYFIRTVALAAGNGNFRACRYRLL